MVVHSAVCLKIAVFRNEYNFSVRLQSAASGQRLEPSAIPGGKMKVNPGELSFISHYFELSQNKYYIILYYIVQSVTMAFNKCQKEQRFSK